MGCCLRVVGATLLLFLAYFLYIALRTVELPPLESDPWWKSGPRQKEDPRIQKFFIKVPERDIQDLQNRLDLPMRLTPPLENVNFTYGMNTNAFNEIMTYWKTKYNWDTRQKHLNSVMQYKTEIEGLVIHYIRVSPQNVPPDVVVRPLLLVHGWPGSVVEFYDLFPLLTKPQPNSKVVFEVIAPSLPGYAFSEPAEKPGLGIPQIGQIMVKLMKRIGYDKFYTQGGDWGGEIIKSMATYFPNNILGAHVNFVAVNHPWVNFIYVMGHYLPSGWIVDQAKEEHLYPFSKIAADLLRESGYFHIQATKPDTIGVSLNESPVGLAAYILEKFSTWTDPENRNKPDGGLLTNFPISLDAILDNIHVYWFSRCITTSMRLYSENMKDLLGPQDQVPSIVPFGVSSFKHELIVDPPNFVSVKFPNLIYYKIHDFGGHFAAMEQPVILAKDLITFVNIVEKGAKKYKTEL